MNGFDLPLLVFLFLFIYHITLIKGSECPDRYFTEKLTSLCKEIKHSQSCDCSVLSANIDNIKKEFAVLSAKLDQINSKLTESHQCKLENVAYKKPVTMSSWQMNTTSWHGYICCSSEYATDGNVTTFAHTEFKPNQFMFVDLESVYDIAKIEIINRSDMQHSSVHAWLQNVTIEVSRTLDTMKHCSDYLGPGKRAEHISFVCQQQLSGRYVKFTINNGSWPLILSEINVYAPLKE